jgi:hypothetical protein
MPFNGQQRSLARPTVHAPTATKTSSWMEEAIFNSAIELQEKFLQLMTWNNSSQLDFAWLRGLPIRPTFDHLLLRYKNQLFSIYVDLVAPSETWHVCDDAPHRLQLAVCKQGNIIPCCYPVHKYTLQPLNAGWNLFRTDTGTPIKPQELCTDTLVPMTAWELHAFALQVVQKSFINLDMDVISYTDIPGLTPQMWIKTFDDTIFWLMVRHQVQGKTTLGAPDFQPSGELANYLGFCVDLELSSESQTFYRGETIKHKVLSTKKI